MPSSLMARVKATQDVPTPSSTSAGRSGRSNVITPPPDNGASASSLTARNGGNAKPTSSLSAASSSSLAAASSSSKYSTPNSSVTKASSGYVPKFKQNPLNAATSTPVPSGDTIPTHDNNDISATKAADAAARTHSKTMSTKPPPPTPKTLIQQLLQHSTTKQQPTILTTPPPYYMCSESEAYDRQQHLELSPLECIPGTIQSGVISTINSTTHDNDDADGGFTQSSCRFGGPASPSPPSDLSRFGGPPASSPPPSTQKAARRHRPTYNPHHVVKKYRRSAAGGGALSEASDACPRTLDQLDSTVDYLLQSIFACQMPPYTDTTTVMHHGDNEDEEDGDPNEISIWEEDTPVKQRPVQQLHEQHTPFSLSDTVSFIDDRLRAVQKDLVTLLGNIEDPSTSQHFILGEQQQQISCTVRAMQAKMVRYNILASYLLSDVPASKYEVKFGARALRTSLTCYLNLSTSLHDEYNNPTSTNNNSSSCGVGYQEQYQKECRIQDEIMAYMALLHSSAVLRAEESALPPPTASEITSSLMEDSGSGWGAILSTFCKHVLHEKDAIKLTTGSLLAKKRKSIVEKYPRWKWALELACSAQERNYQRYFNLLERGPSILQEENVMEDSAEVAADNARFLIVARCCASHSLNLARLGQIRLYNHAFGKGEKVPAKDLARLLRFGNDRTKGADKAVNLCRDAGLPIVEKEGGELFVVMKSAPISIKGDEAIERICKPGRMNDLFVFGSKFDVDEGRGSEEVDSLANQLSKQCDLKEDVDDWEDRDGSFIVQPDTSKEVNVPDSQAREDEDKVLIPPSSVMRVLVK